MANAEENSSLPWYRMLFRFVRRHKFLFLVPFVLTIVAWIVLVILTENFGDAPFVYAVF